MKIILASTPKEWSGLIDIIQQNAVTNWKQQLIPDGWDFEIILYGDDVGTHEACSHFEITHVPDIECTEYGTPKIGWIFSDLQQREAEIYIYINADIILSNENVLQTLVDKYTQTEFFTGTAPRTGLIVTEYLQNWNYFYSATEAEIKIAKPRCGVDIFIFTKDTIPKMPDFALGRGFWDKWFVIACRDLATQNGIDFINFAGDFWTIHQSHDYSHLPIKNKTAWDTRGFVWENGEGKGPETKINHKLFVKDYPQSKIKQPYVNNCVANPKSVKQKNYHLLNRRCAGTEHHYAGWPWIHHALKENSTGKILFDDFVSQTFEWGFPVYVHKKPWVGIFHHPVTIEGPVGTERTILNFPRTREWEISKKNLIGAVALCEEGADYLCDKLNIPVLKVLHPTNTKVGKWSHKLLLKQRPLVLLQVGESHRDIRFIHKINCEKYWKKKRLIRNSSSMQRIDEKLKKFTPDNSGVEDLGRLSNPDYDTLLCSCVAVQYVYGAAANNTVIECMVRGTPLLTNRLPAIVEYLGPNYPLYIDSPDIPKHYWYATTLKAASAYLLERAKILPTREQFVEQIDQFIGAL